MNGLTKCCNLNTGEDLISCLLSAVNISFNLDLDLGLGTVNYVSITYIGIAS